MDIAVITSMKNGLNHFVYRELLVFSEQGVSIYLFPTKYQLGLYNKRKEWGIVHWNPIIVVLYQVYFFLMSPLKYIFLFWEALVIGALKDCVIAWYFANYMGDIDVIYSIFGDHKLFIGYFCKRIIGKPLVVIIHAYELYNNPNPKLFVRALEKCDQIITVTEYNKELLADKYHINPSKVEVVRVSVDVENYRPSSKFVILIVAFFDERKGHEILFNAIKEINQEDIEVWIVGGKTGRGIEVDVYSLVSQMGLESQVALFGKLSGTALKAVYRACDVFCLPCRESSNGISEGFPTVLMEAMAFGKPVITTRHVEIPRIIPEILVDENDVHGLAQAIRQAYQSKTLRKSLGVKNRRIAEDLFSTRNAMKTLRLLSNLSTQDK